MSNLRPVSTRWQHSPETWAKREYFTSQLEGACEDRGLSVEWLDDEKWTGLLRSPDGEAPIYGYDLGLNSSASARIADSKADTYRSLQLRNVSAIRHERLSPNLSDGRRLGTAALTAMAIESVGLPLVAKPDALASGGKGVELCRDDIETFNALDRLTDDGAAAAVSPYIDFDEYRAVVLDGRVRVVIEKTRAPDSWMHNHSKGARHQRLDSTDDVYCKVGSLGVRAAIALDMRFATVDIARTPEEEFAVLELNDAVSIVYPQDPELEKIARGVYGDAVKLRLTDRRPYPAL